MYKITGQMVLLKHIISQDDKGLIDIVVVLY